MDILIGSNNQHKCKQFTSVINEFYCDANIKTAGDFSIDAPAEHGETFEDNCLMKLEYYSNFFDGFCISDDSGICVDCLDGAPGVYTADWAVNGDFKPAIEKLQKMLYEKCGRKERYDAKFVSVVAVLNKTKGIKETYRHEADGYINFDRCDIQGIGFQPIFYLQGHNMPVANNPEFNFSDKNPRVIALKKILNKLNNEVLK